MQEGGLKARVRKRFKCTTINDPALPVAANLLGRQFTAEAPNQRWVGDTTEFIIGESTKLYLAAILDLSSRFIVGWAVSPVNDRHLTIKALEMALKRRAPDASKCSITSDADTRRWAKSVRRPSNGAGQLTDLTNLSTDSDQAQSLRKERSGRLPPMPLRVRRSSPGFPEASAASLPMIR